MLEDLTTNLSFPLGHAKNIQKDLVGDGGVVEVVDVVVGDGLESDISA